MFALRGVTHLLGLVRIVVVARLLAPKDFGLFGIALLVISSLETFSQTGFEKALIQKKGDLEPYLDTVWTFQAIRGMILALILFGIAPYVAAFFQESIATPMLRMVGLSMLVTGLTNIGVIYFQKELEFHKQFVYQLSGTLADLGVSVTAAVLFRNVWALVFGFLAGNLVRVTVSYLVHSYRPRISMDLGKAEELFVFGKWIFFSSILFFLLMQGDDIFVGKLLGVTLLGFYQMAYRIANMPATEITHVISQVTFPAYSKLQDDIPQLREAYLKILQLTTFLSFPMAGLIFVLAPDFTKIFLGEKWLPMVPTMQALVLCGLIRSIAATCGPIFQGVGKPAILTKSAFARLVLLVIFIYPLTIKWNILGTSLALLLSYLPIEPIIFHLTIKIIHCRVWEFGKLIALPMLGTLVMSCVLLASKYLIFNGAGVFSFFALIFIGVIIYAGMAITFDCLFDYNMKLTVQKSLSFFSERSQNKE